MVKRARRVKPHPWHDSYTLRARKEGYPARSVYKLEEIQRAFCVLKKSGAVLDLGCFPGSWLLYASEIVGGKGRVVGVDITPISIQLPPNVRFLQHDVLAWNGSFLEAAGGPFDTVLSDMAPSSTGSKFVDAQRSLELSESALAVAATVLRAKGAFVCKVFHGSGFKGFSDRAKTIFERVAHVKPKSSRKASKEIFVVGLGKRGVPKKGQREQTSQKMRGQYVRTFQVEHD
ncbi:MAG: RlmE family RNA methyltransferase [Thermodesulfobacteriota bacterium]|nr:RlmE family RNA methyltransferase [Thermodesulfobacteriota bacterium]